MSRRTSSPGGGMSITWHSRISTISAAARRSGAASTSATPFSSICQVRLSTGMESWSARAAPRVRSASGSAGPARSSGTERSRASMCTSSSRSPSTVPRSAPKACARSVIASAACTFPAATASISSNTSWRSARPSMSATSAWLTSAPSMRAIAWSSRLRPSRAEPSAARAISSIAGAATATCSAAATRVNRPASSAAEMRRRSKRWQRDSTVIGTLRISVVAKMKAMCGGGSSSVFSRALKAWVVSMWTSSRMNTLVRACSGL